MDILLVNNVYEIKILWNKCLIKVTIILYLCVLLMAGESEHLVELGCALAYRPPEGEVIQRQTHALLSEF